MHLRLDRGTLVTRECPEVMQDLFTWDARSQSYRARALEYRTIMERARAAGLPVRDEAAAFQKLDLSFVRDQRPYPHQVQALSAWKAAGRRGVAVLPTGAGKTYLAQLAMRDTPRSTLITVPTLDLMEQWYSGLIAAFPDASVGLLGGGSHDETPILIATYDSAAIHAETLAGRYALLICDEVHHLPSDFTRVIAEMSLAPYRLGLSATLKRSDGRERDLETLIGPVVCTVSPADLAGDTLADYRLEVIRVKLSRAEQERYDELIRLRNDFLRQEGIRFGSVTGWQEFVAASGTQAGRTAMRAHLEAKGIAYGTEGKLRVLEAILAEHPDARTLIFTNDNAAAYRVSREFLIPVITHQTPVKERSVILDRFRSGEYQYLATSRVLNEGVDVPEASLAVVLSGTSTEREHVQRLGRILRKSEGKQAVLYEVITEGTSEERVSQQRKGQWRPGEPVGIDRFWEDVNAPGGS